MFLEGLVLLLLLFSLLVVAVEALADFPGLPAAVLELVLGDTDGATGIFSVLGFWDWVWILGLTCTSQGGGALL